MFLSFLVRCLFPCTVKYQCLHKVNKSSNFSLFAIFAIYCTQQINYNNVLIRCIIFTNKVFVLSQLAMGLISTDSTSPIQVWLQYRIHIVYMQNIKYILKECFTKILLGFFVQKKTIRIYMHRLTRCL